MDNRFEVVVGAGTLMSDSTAAARFPHRWTPEGVTVEADFTGGYLLHLPAAGCVLNDVYGRPRVGASTLRESGSPRPVASTRPPGSPRVSAIQSKSAPMHLPASLRIFSRSWTRLPRFHMPSGPEPSSGECHSPDPAGDGDELLIRLSSELSEQRP
jgi:hypothetical protein